MAEKYLVAGSTREAAALKTSDAAYLAGGTEINRLGSTLSPDILISLKNLKELKQISICNDNDGKEKVSIGALSTFQEIIDSKDAPDYLKEACRFMGSMTKRNMATIGGNIALCRDDSYLLPTLIAAGAGLLLMDAEGKSLSLSLEEYIKEQDAVRNLLIMSVILPASLDFIKANRQANTVESNARLTVCVGISQGHYKAAAAIKNCGLFVLDDLSAMLEADPALSEPALISWAEQKELPVQDDKVFGGAAYRRYLLGAVIARLLRDYGKGGQP